MLEDVAGDEGLVDARIFVRLEVLQRFLRDAFMLRSICKLSAANSMGLQDTRAREFTPLLGGIFGLVAGGGSDMSLVGMAGYI